jgi:hypothetical protein
LAAAFRFVLGSNFFKSPYQKSFSIQLDAISLVSAHCCQAEFAEAFGGSFLTFSISYSGVCFPLFCLERKK